MAFFWNISILDSVKDLLIACGIVDLTLQLMRKAKQSQHVLTILYYIVIVLRSSDIPMNHLSVLINGFGLLANLLTSSIHRSRVSRKDVIERCFEVFHANESIPSIHEIVSQARLSPCSKCIQRSGSCTTVDER